MYYNVCSYNVHNVHTYVYTIIHTCTYYVHVCMYIHMYVRYVHCTCTFIFFVTQGGPSPRSCHKMCLDSDNQVLYILGQYLDQDTRTSLFTVTIPVDL